MSSSESEFIYSQLSCNNNNSSRGAVTVSMEIKKLDISQCPGDYYTPNAFKRTHKRDDKTSYVSHIA